MNKGQQPQQGVQQPQKPQQPQQSQPQQGNPLAGMMGSMMGGGGAGNPLAAMMGMGGPRPSEGVPPQNNQMPRTTSPARSDMSGPDGLDELISKMNLEPNKIPDLDNISLTSAESDKKSGGITLNL